MKKSIFPNLVTLYNLLCGCVAMISILNEWYGVAFLCFIMALIADFADGLVARALNVSSEMGKQLDSLADMISFGAVPGTILFALLAKSWYGDIGYQQYFPWLALPGFFFTGFAAYRLGKFNIDTRQSEEFRGLATPGATVFVVGIMMAYKEDFYGLATSLINPWFLYMVTIIISILMISDVKMFSFKVKNTHWKGNELRYIFIFAAITGLFLFQYLGLSLAVLLYVILSLMYTNRESTIEIA